jgi:tetratricopeptide (TPR) repeat protein
MPVAPAEIESLLADLLLHQDRPREARRHLERALAADPGFVPARDGLAQVALSQARWDEARAQLKAALDREPESPLALHRFADALVKEASRRGEVLSDAETDAAVSALEKAVGQAPHFADAAELLARLRPQPPRRRIALLEPVFTREPQRTDIGITLAGLYVRVNDLGRAAAVLTRAQASARDENMRFLAGHLRARIGFAASQTREVTGTLVRLECQAEGALDFVMEVADRRLVLRAPGPRAVLLYGPDGDHLERELICGPQRAAVSAFYLRRDGEADGLEGTLLSMTWSEISS